MKEEEKIKDLKAVYSGAVQADKIELANMIKGGIDLIEKLQKENEKLKVDMRNMYNEEVIINIICEEFHLNRDEVLDLLNR